MLVNTAPRRKNNRKVAAETKRCPVHLQWLRGRPCVLESAGDCDGRIEAAHVDFLGHKGLGTKTEDWNAIPLCAWHHQRQHNLGWATFQHRYAFNAAQAAHEYAKASPHRAKWETRP